MTISDIFSAENTLSRLDLEVLLAHVLNVSRSYLFAHPETILTSDQENFFLECVKRASDGEPIAYLTGHREFWSLDLKVTPDTLIPRPETELLVELVLKNTPADKRTVADLGTGSGAIALALAHERPNWTIYATDVSEKALVVAKENSVRLRVQNIIFSKGSWCEALPQLNFDVIVSNPPYIDENDIDLQPAVLFYEPRAALISENQGCADLEKIIFETKPYLKAGGYLFLEHGFRQAEKIKKIFIEAGYTNVNLYQDFAGLDRVTSARKI